MCLSVCVLGFVWVFIVMAYNDTSVFVSYSLLLSVLPQVMRETDTQVKWPSKLKIGAKSKKGDKLYKLLYLSYSLAVIRVLSLSFHIFLCYHKVILPIYKLKCMALKIKCNFHLDPHVKVEGKRVNVLEAKKKILDVLETRVSTVLFMLHLLF